MAIERRFGKKTRGVRSTGNRERRAKVLLVLGGIRTEADYFNWIKKALATPGLHVEIEGQGWDPETLFEHAIALKQADERLARKERDPANAYDAVWVVTDVDDFYDHLMRIRPRQDATGVQIAITNPCFESWLNMHHDSSAAPVDRFQAQRRAKELGVVEHANPKRIIPAALEGRYEVAAETARGLATRHENNGTVFPHDSPSTSVDQIVGYLVNRARASAPQLVVNI